MLGITTHYYGSTYFKFKKPNFLVLRTTWRTFNESQTAPQLYSLFFFIYRYKKQFFHTF